MVIPRFVSQALRGEPITVYGDGSQTRCFCHVGDVVKAMVDLMNNAEAYGRVFNLGGNEEISMNDLAQRIVDITGSSSKIKHMSYEEAYEEGFEDMQRRVPDTTRANGVIGFEPTVGLNEIIESVVDAHRS
jgi:UDP-glucose 4-epimerase